MSVSIPFSAQPDQVLEAFRRIQEEARKTGQQLKGLGDVNFPGLESARQKLADLQPGFEQLFSKTMRGEAAGALRSGNNNGVYDKDIVSWLGNVSKQFPDQKELVRHLKAVIEQAGRVSQYMPGTSPISPHNPSSPLPPTFSPIPNPSSTIPGSGLRSWWRWDGLQPPIGHPGAHPWGLPKFPMWGGTLGGGGLPNFPYHPMNLGGGGGMIAPPLPHIPPGGGTPGGAGWYGGPGMGGAIGGFVSGNIGGVAGGVLGGLMGGPLGAMIGGAIGGKLQGAVGKYADQSMQESFGMTDFRRSVYGINEDFVSFRKNIRAAGDGLGVTYNETLALSKSFAQLSGATGSSDVAGGARASILMSRQFGLDPSQGASMMGRASFLGLGGGDISRQAKMLAEAMAGSNLGARQADAADAMLRFAEKSASIVGDGGDVQGYTGRLLALFNSGNNGIKANAANILGGYDDSVRSGGRAGDAGKNFIYRTMMQNGTTDPFDVEMALEGGFTGKMANGQMIGPALLRNIKKQYGGMGTNAMASATKGLFGGSASIAKEIIDLLIKNPNMSDEAAGKKVESLMASLGDKNDQGNQLRIATANLNNAAQQLMGDNMLPIMVKMNEVLTDLTRAIDAMTGRKSTLGNQSLVKELNEKNAMRMQSSDAFKKWGIGGGGGYGKQSGLGAKVGDIHAEPDSSAPGSHYTDAMRSPYGKRMLDSQAIAEIGLIAKKSGVKHMIDPANNGQINVAGGNQASIERFIKAIDKFADLTGFNINVHVGGDKKGAAVVKRPAHR